MIAPATAEEEHKAELQQPVEADVGDTPLGDVQGEDFTTADLD